MFTFNLGTTFLSTTFCYYGTVCGKSSARYFDTSKEATDELSRVFYCYLVTNSLLIYNACVHLCENKAAIPVFEDLAGFFKYAQHESQNNNGRAVATYFLDFRQQWRTVLPPGYRPERGVIIDHLANMFSICSTYLEVTGQREAA